MNQYFHIVFGLKDYMEILTFSKFLQIHYHQLSDFAKLLQFVLKTVHSGMSEFLKASLWVGLGPSSNGFIHSICQVLIASSSLDQGLYLSSISVSLLGIPLRVTLGLRTLLPQTRTGQGFIRPPLTFSREKHFSQDSVLHHRHSQCRNVL